MQVTHRTCIDINYQYRLAAWVYRAICISDQEFGRLYHDSGVCVQEDCKGMKLFTFSNLHIPNYRISGRVICILSDTMSFVFSTCIREVGLKLIDGAMKLGRVEISEHSFPISDAVMFPEVVVRSGVFRTLSPVFLRFDEVHLRPDENSDFYSQVMHQNLSAKYNLFHQTAINDFVPIKIRVLGDVKSKLITIKEWSDNGCRFKGYLFCFSVEGDSRLIDMGYQAGFGRLCSMGFGCVEAEESDSESFCS